MNSKNLAKIRLHLTAAVNCCTKLKPFIGEIAETNQRRKAEHVWFLLDMSIRKVNDGMKAWKIGYPKGKHRIEGTKVEAIRQWHAAPHPKPKVRALAKSLKLSPTTVYAVLKELGWKKPAKE